MINIQDIIRRLTGNADAVRALIQTISDEQAQWKPAPETWSMKEVMEHVYNEERLDFRKHLKELLNDPPLAWGASEKEPYITVGSCLQALEGFLIEREASIAWLMTLERPDWDTAAEARFGPKESEEVIVLHAGDVLISWIEHDFLHMRQMIELHYAWTEKEASPYSVGYAGGW